MPKNVKESNDALKKDSKINGLKDIILQEEKKVLHLRKHGMNDKIIELIKARVK